MSFPPHSLTQDTQDTQDTPSSPTDGWTVVRANKTSKTDKPTKAAPAHKSSHPAGESSESNSHRRKYPARRPSQAAPSHVASFEPRKRSNSITSISSDVSAASDDSVESEDGIEPPPESFDAPASVMCPLDGCEGDGIFSKPRPLVEHLLHIHSLRIHNLHHMFLSLQAYLEAWAGEIRTHPAPEGTFTESGPENTVIRVVEPERCPFDQALRTRLQREKLESILAIQERERRADSLVGRKCLFCKHPSPSRATLFRHMFTVHNFNIGLPDNLVNVADYLSVLEGKLESLQCLYCEKTFTTPAVLRKHMRKKKHFKISPWNRIYDRYYIVNYLEPGKTWQHFEGDANDSDDEKLGGAADTFEDWDEPDVEPTQCLFDEVVCPSPEAAAAHMIEAHGYDLLGLQQARHLDFYKMVALINYTRAHVIDLRCPAECGEEEGGRAWSGPEALLAHMTEADCFTRLPPPEAPVWHDPQFLFPTMEDDPLLMLLGQGDDNDEDDEEAAAEAEIAEAEATTDGATGEESSAMRRRKEETVRMLREMKVDPTAEDVNRALIREAQRLQTQRLQKKSSASDLAKGKK